MASLALLEIPKTGERALSSNRGVVKTSLTRLTLCLDSIECTPALDSVKTHLKCLVAKFQVHHYAMLDCINEEDEGSFQAEQEEMNDHKDLVAELTAHL